MLPCAELLRVAVEHEGFVGFIEATAALTLAEARKRIDHDLPDAPRSFKFVLPDGVPVNDKQEARLSIAHFRPCLTLRPTLDPKQESASLQRVTVRSFANEECSVWASPSYTFGQLRREAAQYWGLPPDDVMLQDDNGCLWPEDGAVLATLGLRGASPTRRTRSADEGAAGPATQCAILLMPRAPLSALQGAYRRRTPHAAHATPR